MKSYRFLIFRRLVQFGIFFLFIAGNYWGWTVLRGNLSQAKLFEYIPLSDPLMIIQTLASGFVVGTDVLIGGAFILIFYGLFTGRAFCSWVCPVNPVADLANWINRKTKWAYPASKINIPKRARYYILLLALFLSVLLGYAAFEMVSPIGMFSRALIFGSGSGFAVIGVIFLADLFIRPYFFCSHLCPLGAFYAFAGRFHFIKVQHKVEACTQCNLCFAHCPEKQVLDIIGKTSGPIKNPECTNCGRCIEVCDDNALKFKIF